jgi:hypothetical protein
MDKEMRCCTICYIPIETVRFAIRDIVPYETTAGWLWRHVVGFCTFGFKRRKYAVILPVCHVCAGERLAYNIAGKSASTT